MSHRNAANCEKRGGAAKGEFPEHFCGSLVLDSPAHWMPCKNCGSRNSSHQNTHAQRRAWLPHNAATTFAVSLSQSAPAKGKVQIGRASCRERVCQYV